MLVTLEAPPPLNVARIQTEAFKSVPIAEVDADDSFLHHHDSPHSLNSESSESVLVRFLTLIAMSFQP